VLNNTAETATYGIEFGLNLVFSDTEAITPQIREPDILDVLIVKPEVFIDAESLWPLEEGESFISVEIQPQMTLSAYEEMMEMAKTAGTIGMGLSIWQIIMCFALGKAINQMWILILTVQFIVYISLW